MFAGGPFVPTILPERDETDRVGRTDRRTGPCSVHPFAAIFTGRGGDLTFPVSEGKIPFAASRETVRGPRNGQIRRETKNRGGRKALD
jgi:hypothetical protein